MSTEMATFETLLDLPPHERARRLGEIRAEAAETATRLERLLGLIAEDLAELDAAASDPRLGTTVGGWTLERRIGEGSSSIVYLGRDVDGDPVAIKILRLDRLGESTRRRFEREIAAHSRLAHPGFARLIASDLAATPPWLAAEWVEDGRPITEWASLHAPSIDERVALITQLREALAAAREAGVVHRDLSPNNVLVDRHGRVKIVDLGIARLLEDDEGFSRLSRTGRHAIGTPAYMAPEQIDPSFGPIGPWTDEYAAALIAYRLLTGKLPYDTSGSFASVAQAIVHVPVEPLDLAECPARLAVESWIRSALVKDVGMRQRLLSELAGGTPDLQRNVWIQPRQRLPVTRSTLILMGTFVAPAIVGAIFLLTRIHASESRNQRGEDLPQQGDSMRLGDALMMAGATASILACTLAHAEVDAVEWRTADGGNGHWYGVLISATAMSWTQARLMAESQGGYLATPVTSSENAFIFTICSAPEAWPSWGPPYASFRLGPWLGGYQDTAAPDYQSPTTGWRWISGEPWESTNWLPGQPDAIGEHFLVYYCGQSICPSWNNAFESGNYGAGIRSLAIEWSADCNGDGIVDFGQIRAGELTDTNGNNIPDCCEAGGSCDPCRGDLDDSGAVNSVDLAIILAAWGTNGGKYPQADIDGSGTVDATDLSEVLAGWGPCPD